MSLATDPARLPDGWSSLEGGMNSARAPSLIDPNQCSVAVNLTFRGGYPQTRPAFHRVASVSEYLSAFQGAFLFTNTVYGTAGIFIAMGGQLFQINPANGVGTNVWDPWYTTVPTYFCAAERFLIMQNGYNDPVVYDSATGITQKAKDMIPDFPMPRGTIMAYGQGRLFIANLTRKFIVAGDLVYGGSETRSYIVSATKAADTVITTNKNHGFTVGDVVTIEGLRSSPDVNGTYRVKTVPALNEFRVGVELLSVGAGGSVIQAIPGEETDLLRFSETTFLAEGYAFQLPSNMGRITGMIFPSLQDTSTGHGDLIVAGEFGMSSFAVSLPRLEWKTQPFQKVVFQDIGSPSPRSFVAVNGDFFFNSRQGIRNYRNSHLAFYAHGTPPLSAELNFFLGTQRQDLLREVSAIEFDNRLLMTALPTYNQVNQLVHQGLLALDFNSISLNFGKTAPAYDGMWTGLDILQVVGGKVNGLDKGYILAMNLETIGTSPPISLRSVSLWEIRAGDRSDTNLVTEVSPGVIPGTYIFTTVADFIDIKTHLESRAYNFGNPLTLKRLERGAIWLNGVSGPVTVSVFFRADQNPIWTSWGSFAVHAEPETGYYPYIQLPTPSGACDPRTGIPLAVGHEFQVRFALTGRARITKLIIHARDQVESVGSQCDGTLPGEVIPPSSQYWLDYSIP